MSALRTSMSSKLDFRLANSFEDYELAFPLILELNPTLSKEKYLLHVQEMQGLGNYYLYSAYLENEFIGLCGYWVASKFYCGKYMEIDNFIIADNHRSKNYGSLFLDFLETKAKELNCETIMLDAYVENFAGHRFYYKNGYIARGYHFLKKL